MVKVAFVIPWFSADAKGGAESQCRHTARALKQHGCEVEVLTTCIEKHDSNWGVNFFPPGDDTADGITVRRFPADPRETPERFGRINEKLVAMNRQYLSGEKGVVNPLSESDENFFVSSMARSVALEEFIRENRGKMDFFIFLPYLFATSLFGVLAAGEKAVLVPCLHNESYAYFSATRSMFQAARGVLFNSMAEADLAGRLFGKLRDFAVVGEGVNFFDPGDPDRFRAHYGIKGHYLLYVGRKDRTKNVHRLIMDFLTLERELNVPISLVLAGPGRADFPGASRIIDAGYLAQGEKADAMAGALALVNPSSNESFSLVIMESWLSRRPVLVNRACEVTAEHCKFSHGGLAYGNTAEFVESVKWLLENGEKADAMGRQGNSYVRRNYDWPVIVRRYLDFLARL